MHLKGLPGAENAHPGGRHGQVQRSRDLAIRVGPAEEQDNTVVIRQIVQCVLDLLSDIEARKLYRGLYIDDIRIEALERLQRVDRPPSLLAEQVLDRVGRDAVEPGTQVSTVADG